MQQGDDLVEPPVERAEAAADDAAHPMRLVVLATTTADGGPDARIMVLRGADPRRGKLWFHTDRRSNKVEQLRRSSTLCGVAYDVRDGIQLRLRGDATIHEASPLADRHWSQTSNMLRALYALP